jgi:hypothetical protein
MPQTLAPVPAPGLKHPLMVALLAALLAASAGSSGWAQVPNGTGTEDAVSVDTFAPKKMTNDS